MGLGMADGSPLPADAPSGRIRREDADQILMWSLVAVCTRLFDDSDMEVALHLVERALPLVSASTHGGFKPIAEALVRNAPLRRRPEGAARWAEVNMDLRQALSRDALAQAIRRVEV
jgi:hypothetical protein